MLLHQFDGLIEASLGLKVLDAAVDGRYTLQQVGPLECEEVMHNGFFKLLEALSGDLFSLIVCHSVVVLRFLFDRSVAVVHEVHGHARHALVGVREEVTFGAESRFRDV